MSLSDSPPADPGRYSLHGGPALDALVDGVLREVADALRESLGEELLDALVLGGGYGRGEGGVLFTPEGPRPFNDFDLVLLHHHSDERRVARALREIGAAQARSCSVHVDVTPLRSDRLARLPAALTWYELGCGHQLVWGRPEALDPLRERRLEDVHPTEWGRLLTNRAFGLALSLRQRAGRPCPLLAGEEAAAAETRHVQKAWLALGDVWLADRGLYRPLARERAEAFEGHLGTGGEEAPDWADDYRAALRFKLLPTLAPLPEAEGQAARLAGLLCAQLRRRRAAPARPLVGLVATLRRLPPGAWLRSAPWRSPRERLRLGLIAELERRPADRDRWCGSEAGLDALWQAHA